MHDAPPMRSFQGAGEGQGDVEQLFEREGAARLEEVRHRRSFDQLEDQKVQALRLFDGVDGDDVRVVECRRRPRFALEALDMPRLGGQRRCENLERHAAAEPQVLRLEDLSHAPLADRPEDPVAGQGAPGEQVRCGVRDGHETPLSVQTTPSGHRIRRGVPDIAGLW